MDLTPELAALALRRIAMLREQKSLDPDVDETYYWAYFVEYFSPWVRLASTEKEVEPATLKLADMLDELRIEENEVLTVPESFRVPSGQIAAVECEQMIVCEDCIAFTAIPKHASFHVQTVEITLAMLEAAVTSASTTHV
jgi:sulfur carrier protein ThiS